MQTPIFILSPTASGKSRLAHQLALSLKTEIISLDSMKIFRGMDIGTAKPPRKKQQEIPYHMIDVADPDQYFDVSAYMKMAEKAALDIRERDRTPIFSGGTALYAKCLLYGLFSGPGADKKTRDRIRTRLAKEGNEKLFVELQAVDPEASERIHPNDSKRLVRALEVYTLTGKPISAFQQQFGARSFRFPARLYGLLIERRELRRRIDERVDRMIRDGLVEETEHLLSRWKTLGPQSAKAVGYKQACEFLGGDYDHTEMIDKIKIATHRLARHQMTWFRKFPITWLPPEKAHKRILEDTPPDRG